MDDFSYNRLCYPEYSFFLAYEGCRHCLQDRLVLPDNTDIHTPPLRGKDRFLYQ